MKKALLLLSLLLVSSPALSQPAIFENKVFTIPQGAALVEGELLYYNAIELAADSDGRFSLLDAQLSAMVSVDSVTVDIAESLPVQVTLTVKGNKSVPCVELQTPAVIVSGTSFLVALAETRLGPAETCIAVLEPFEIRIPLDITGLGSGSYSVSVNGVESGFSL